MAAARALVSVDRAYLTSGRPIRRSPCRDSFKPVCLARVKSPGHDLDRCGSRDAPGLLAGTLAISACGSPSRLLEQTGLSRSTLTPSTTDRIDLSYTLTRAARVSLTLTHRTASSVDLARGRASPAAGAYVHALDGTIPAPDRPGERRVPPDGMYRLISRLATVPVAPSQHRSRFRFKARIRPRRPSRFSIYPSVLTQTSTESTMSHRRPTG